MAHGNREGAVSLDDNGAGGAATTIITSFVNEGPKGKGPDLLTCGILGGSGT